MARLQPSSGVRAWIACGRDSPGSRAALLVILIAGAGACLHFLDRFPNGWDPAEYAWCARDLRLPHGPYIVHLLAGRLFSSFFEAPLALSLLSLCAGLAALALLHALRLREGSSATGALAAVTLMASTHLFVRQASTQEIYALQTAALLAAILASTGCGRHATAASGVLFGTAVGVHVGSLFVAPALLQRCVVQYGWRGAARWVCFAGAAASLWIGVIAWLLPYESDTRRLGELLLYLRGLPPVHPLVEPGLLGSLAGLAERLTSSSTPMFRGPLATGPTGLSGLLCIAAAAGAIAAAKRAPKAATFWVLYPLPYVAYEVWVGTGLDWGIYLPMLLPPLVVLAGELVQRVVGELPGRLLPRVAAALLVAILAAPSLRVVRSRWLDPELDALLHYRPTTLAAIWVSEHLPEDAIVIQASREPNANLLPYYARRTHVISDGVHDPMILVDRGRFTPMVPRSYRAFRTERILELLERDRPIYAFEPDPFRRVRDAFVDSRRFAWDPAGEARPAEVIATLPVGAAIRDRLAPDPVPLFRMRALPRGPEGQ